MKARGAKEKFGQQSLTSWLRPKTLSTVQSSTEDSGGGQRLLSSWMRRKSSPAPAVYAAPVPVVEYISPAPAGYTAPAALVEPALTVFAAHDAVVEYISLATAMSLAAPTSVQYATPVKHAAPEQYGAPMMTVNGVDLNRDGISDVLQQPQVGIRRLSNTEHLSSMEDQRVTHPCSKHLDCRVDTILSACGKVVRTLRCPLSALMR